MSFETTYKIIQFMNIIAIIFWAIMLTVIVVIYRKWFGES